MALAGASPVYYCTEYYYGMYYGIYCTMDCDQLQTQWRVLCIPTVVVQYFVPAPRDMRQKETADNYLYGVHLITTTVPYLFLGTPTLTTLPLHIDRFKFVFILTSLAFIVLPDIRILSVSI